MSKCIIFPKGQECNPNGGTLIIPLDVPDGYVYYYTSVNDGAFCFSAEPPQKCKFIPNPYPLHTPLKVREKWKKVYCEPDKHSEDRVSFYVAFQDDKTFCFEMNRDEFEDKYLKGEWGVLLPPVTMPADFARYQVTMQSVEVKHFLDIGSSNERLLQEPITHDWYAIYRYITTEVI